MNDPARIIDEERGEAEEYAAAKNHDEINLPLTRLGFDALVTEVGKRFNLPTDDSARSVIAVYFHHLAQDVCTTDISTLGTVLHKAIANSTSWIIDQEIKAAKNEALNRKHQEALAAEAKAKEESTLAAVDSGAQTH